LTKVKQTAHGFADVTKGLCHIRVS